MDIKILMTDGFEEIEAITLIDLLRRAGYKLEIVSVTGSKHVIGSHKISIAADVLFNDVNFDKTDMIILPGGPGVSSLKSNSNILELLQKANTDNKYICAICAAPIVLEKAGIIKGKKICCYPTVEEEIKSAEILIENVVVDGKIITSRGVGTAIDMGLKIVEVLSSNDESEKLRKTIVYSG